MVVTDIDVVESTDWMLRNGRLVHRTGGFFSVLAARAGDSSSGALQSVWQPLIDQPEVGLLGFMLRDGPAGNGPELLVQAKPEPGNVGLVQLAPSVQATRSNYLRVHGGRPTKHLDRFTSPHRVELSSSLQSEQGTRFLGKYNRNVTIHVAGDQANSGAELRWCSVVSVQQALGVDFAVNTDARSVLITTPWRRLVQGRDVFDRPGGNEEFRSQLHSSSLATHNSRAAAELRVLDVARREMLFDVEHAPLTSIAGCEDSDQRIHSFGDDLRIVHVAVTCSHREVESWDQPLLASNVQGDVRLLCQVREGVLQFLFCAAPELGFVERAQFGPTIQSQGGPTLTSHILDERARLLGELADGANRQLSVLQSDEGGRFMRCISRYSIDQLAPDVHVPTVPWSAWMHLGTIAELLQIQGVFDNEARSALSLLLTEL